MAKILGSVAKILERTVCRGGGSRSVALGRTTGNPPSRGRRVFLRAAGAAIRQGVQGVQRFHGARAAGSLTRPLAASPPFVVPLSLAGGGMSRPLQARPLTPKAPVASPGPQAQIILLAVFWPLPRPQPPQTSRWRGHRLTNRRPASGACRRPVPAQTAEIAPFAPDLLLAFEP